MFNLNTYLKFLSKNKLYTFVNVFGLSVSLMFVILIANYTIGEFTTDNFQKNADQIYVMSNEDNLGTAYKIGERLSIRYPEIEKVCGVIPVRYNEPVPVEIMDNKVNAIIVTVDSTFMDMFSFKLLQGDRTQALKTKHDVLISETFARKAFGNQDPIGNSIVIQDSIVYTINGVIEDFKNSMFQPKDIIMRVENMNYFDPRLISDRLQPAGSTTLFVQTTKGSNIKAKEDEVLEYFKTFFWVYKNKIQEKVVFTPMRDLYFNQDLGQWTWNTSDKTMLTILVLVGLLILLFAVFNYINLTVAQTGFRAKEMATRRLYGASKETTLGKMIIESFFLCLMAFIVGYLIAFAVEPYVSNLINKDIQLRENLTISMVLQSFLFIVLLGVVSGVIPAVAISRFKPIDVVKGTFAFKSKMTFSKIFITLQSVITVILIACSITIYKQVNHLTSYDYGYNHKAIINIPGTTMPKMHGAFRDRLKALPSIKSVGFSNGTPFQGYNRTAIEIIGTEKAIGFNVLTSDSATVKMFGFEFLKDNNLAERGWWVNQTTLNKIGATDELKAVKTKKGGAFKVAGVVKDFTIGDIVGYGDQKTPLLLQISNNIKRPKSVLVQIQGDLVQGYRDVKRTFEEITDGVEFTGKFISSEIEESYTAQRRIQKIMVVFSIIAMIISSLGLLAISSYFIQQRSREIAVRKVFGATRMEVLILVIWKFIRLVVIAFVIACPIIWYAMSQWLNDFPYRIDMSIWILLAAGLFNLVVAFLTVYWQSSRVADTNPIKAIHD